MKIQSIVSNFTALKFTFSVAMHLNGALIMDVKILHYVAHTTECIVWCSILIRFHSLKEATN